MAKRSLQDDYQRFVRYWEALNKPPPPPSAPPPPPPEPIELVQAQINAHEGSEGTAVHGLGSAALEDKEAFEQTGAVNQVREELDNHTRVSSHPSSAAEIGADEAGAAGKVKLELWKHEADQENPHNVTAEQVGIDLEALAKAEHNHPGQTVTRKGGGGGNVLGPSHATDSNLASFDNDTGKRIKDSGYKPDDFQSAMSFPLSAALGGTGVDNTGKNLTVPATGTAALLGTANVFTAENTFDLGLIVNDTGSAAGDLRAESDTETNMVWLDASTDILHLGGSVGTQVAKGGYLLVPAGTTTSAPFQLTAGDLLSTPAAGSLEFDGTGIYLTPTNHRRFISLASDSVIVTTTTALLTPVEVWTGVLNADELKAHRVYRIWGCGVYTAHDANDQCTILVKFGDLTVCSLTTPKGIATNSPWHFEAVVTLRTIGVGGTASAHGHFISKAGDAGMNTEEFAVNTTISNDAHVIVQWNDTLNSISLHQCWMQTMD